MKNIYLILSLLIGNLIPIIAQSITGKVTDAAQKPLIGVNLYWANATHIYSQSDSLGNFTLVTTPLSQQLVVTLLGYQTDTLNLVNLSQPLNLVLKEFASKEVVVIGKQNATTLSTLPIRTELINEKELKRAACCNVSESFETNPSVDASMNDAVSGMRQIQLLGLSGKYAQTTIENLPLIRGMNIESGLSSLPGTWVKSIQVSKGVGSVVQGYEAITGQINIELKDPESTEEKILFNAYQNHLGRSEANLNLKTILSPKVKMMTMAHASRMGHSIDRNLDGFMDMNPMQQVGILNRWEWFPNVRWEIRAGIRAGYDERTGGQIHDEQNALHHGHTGMYTIGMFNRRMEAFAKAGRLFEKEGRSLGILASAQYHQQDAHFGYNVYAGNQQTAQIQSIVNEPLSKRQTLKTGISYRYDAFQETFNPLSLSRIEHVAGVFGEYTYNVPKKFVFMLGLRDDYHNLWGNILTARLHTKITLPHQISIRLATGNGTRISNIVAENLSLMASSRAWVVAPNLRPEKGWNSGLSIDKKFTGFGREGRMSAETYFTSFQNQIMVDTDLNAHEVHFYNLQGKSYSHVVQTELEYELLPQLTAKVAYKYYHVKTTLHNVLLDKPFIAKHRGLFTLSYTTTNEKWQFDATTQFHGKQRLPSTANNPESFKRPDYSPQYFILLGQIQYLSRKHVEIYVGGENLLDVRQTNPIIDPQNPFGQYFDTTLVYAPIIGITGYAGIRWKW